MQTKRKSTVDVSTSVKPTVLLTSQVKLLSLLELPSPLTRIGINCTVPSTPVVDSESGTFSTITTFTDSFLSLSLLDGLMHLMTMEESQLDLSESATLPPASSMRLASHSDEWTRPKEAVWSFEISTAKSNLVIKIETQAISHDMKHK